jgi:N-acetylglucosamine-6-sulfatase
MQRKTASIFQSMLAIIMLLSTAGCNLFQKDERPNILLIVTDDQRLGTMEYMPQTQSLIFDQGVTFSNGFVTTPLCCPSRASILTGMYAHNHNVRENEDKLQHTTFMEVLHRNGYYTGLVGKYLNSWNGEPRAEYDYWVSYAKGETRYYNPRLNVNGEWKRHQDQYVTYALGDYAVEFLGKASKQRKPFILLFTPNAPHLPTTPAKEDEGLLTDLPPYRPPSFNEADMSDKPEWIANRPLLTEDEIKAIDKYRRDQLLTLIALDRTIGRVISTLKDTGELDNTLIVFISDNGVFWGEHRFDTAKNRYYDENVHVPFAIRYPPLIPKPYIENKIVANIDIAPTVFDLAGIPIPVYVDGVSMLNLLKREGTWRESLLLEGGVLDGSYVGIRSEQYFYGENDGYPEFYDMQKDPLQLDNLTNKLEYDGLIAQYKTIMDTMAQPKIVPTVTP